MKKKIIKRKFDINYLNSFEKGKLMILKIIIKLSQKTTNGILVIFRANL